MLFRDAQTLLERKKLVVSEEQNSNTPATLYLAPVIRVLCFRLILNILYGIEPTAPPEEDVELITKETNLQWIWSKGEGQVTKSASLLETLNQVLSSYAPGHTSSPGHAEDSLALILPSYETLWRVVLLTFVTMCNRTDKPVDLNSLRLPFCLGGSSDAEKKALNVAKEGLRLYPSTKRIYR
jgi:hypothetical protein